MKNDKLVDIELAAHGIDVPVVVQRKVSGHDSGISWGTAGSAIIICMVAPDGSRMTAQLDEHQLHAMAIDLASMVRAMPPRSESERTLQ